MPASPPHTPARKPGKAGNVENGQHAKQSAQDLTVYTDGSVTKDPSGKGFTVKQGATTVHEDSATSSLTMEGEAVTHALRWTASRSLSDHTCHHPQSQIQ